MARLGLDTSGFKAGLKDAHSAFASVAGNMAKLGSIAGLAAGSRELIEYGAKVYDLGQRFGVSTTALQRFGNAAEENGSSLEGVAKGFNKLDIAISKALGGNAQMITAFAALGVTVGDLRTLSPEELMAKIGKSSMNASDMVKVLGKSALELRPTLAGLANGTIEFGEAIDNDMIAKLKEADKVWRQVWNNIRVVAASALGSIIGEVKFITTSVAEMFGGMKTVILADFLAIKAAAKGDFGEVRRQMEEGRKGLVRLREGAFGDPGKGADATSSAPRTFQPTGDGTKPKSKSELAAEKKDRERDQLSLQDLAAANKGHAATQQGWHGWTGGAMAPGTAQMQYASQQARLVEQLEAQAKQVRLTGISATGETSAGLLSRADAIRQTLPIKETEKEVGIYRDALKGALSGTEEILGQIRDELE